MRIIMLSPHPTVRGPLVKHTPVLVDALRANGCEVVMEPWGRRHDAERLGDKLARAAGDVPRVVRRLKAERFDVMVLKTSLEGRSLIQALPLLIAARQHVRCVVVQFHGGRSDLLVKPGSHAWKCASAAVFRLSDGVLVLSSEEEQELRRFWPRGRFHVVANPYVLADPPKAKPDNGNCRAQRPLTLLFVGRLIAEKGIFELITAFAAAAQQPDSRLVLAGEGPASHEVKRCIAHFGLGHRVALPGFLTGESLSDEYRRADVFVLPSYREGFPTAITEALAAGLPIVTTRTRGMADHLRDEENALLVEPRDVAGLTAALNRILEDEALRQRMSQAAPAKLAEFAPNVVAEQYVDALKAIWSRT